VKASVRGRELGWIGFATAEALLAEGWEVVGVSRNAGVLSRARYTHLTRDVTTDEYRRILGEQSAEPFQAVIYSVGIGEVLNLDELSRDTRIRGESDGRRVHGCDRAPRDDRREAGELGRRTALRSSGVFQSVKRMFE